MNFYFIKLIQLAILLSILNLLLKFFLNRKVIRDSKEIYICFNLLTIVLIIQPTLLLSNKIGMYNRCAYFFMYNLDIFSLETITDLRLVISLPIMCVISLEDILSGWVFDEDIYSGIILNVILIISMFVISIFKKYNGNISDIQLNIYFTGCLEYFKDILFSVAAMFVVTGIISVSTNSLGMGDVFYFTLVSSFVNIYGVCTIFFVSYLFAMIYSSIVIFKKIIFKIFNKNEEYGFNNIRGIQIRFTPFITMATLVTLNSSECIMRVLV